MEKYDTATKVTDDNIIQRMRFAFWINNARDTRSEYVIFMAFPRQKWLRERNSLFRLYVRCLSFVQYLHHKIQRNNLALFLFLLTNGGPHSEFNGKFPTGEGMYNFKSPES